MRGLKSQFVSSLALMSWPVERPTVRVELSWPVERPTVRVEPKAASERGGSLNKFFEAEALRGAELSDLPGRSMGC
jgi:hypothetical protein